MNYFSGATTDIDIVEEIERWVEDNNLFRSCWHCHDASFGYSYGSENGVYKAVEWEFEAPDPLVFILVVNFPFTSEADGETYEDMPSFAKSIFESIEEGISLTEWGKIPSLKWDIDLVTEINHHFHAKQDRYNRVTLPYFRLIVGVDSI